MAIGVFDSGVGGLSVHHKLVDRFPSADFVYLADQANTPYGGRPGEEIVVLTRAGCERLFARGLRPGRAGLQHRLGHRASPPAADLAARLSARARPAGERAGDHRADHRGGHRPALGARGRAARRQGREAGHPGGVLDARPRPPAASTRSRSTSAGRTSRSSPSPARNWRGMIEAGAARDDARRRHPGPCEGDHHADRPRARTGRSSAAPTMRSSPTSSAMRCRPARR